MTWPVEVAHVRAFTADTDTSTDDGLSLAVAAVNAYVPTIPALVEFSTGAGFDPPADVFLGACMLAARWHARRGSSLGTTGYAEFGTSQIMRHDPDVARLLRIGTSSPGFVFGAPTPAEGES